MSAGNSDIDYSLTFAFALGAFLKRDVARGKWWTSSLQSNAGIEIKGRDGNACARGRMPDGLQPVRFYVQAVDRQANHRSGFALGEDRMLFYQPFSVHQIAFSIDVGENMLR